MSKGFETERGLSARDDRRVRETGPKLIQAIPRSLRTLGPPSTRRCASYA
jgi:hypothetical protein